jgi:transcriptional regulator with XRE-family HTH domain
MLSLGEMVLLERRKLGYTQAALAKQACLSRGEISLIERDIVVGLRLITIERLHKTLVSDLMRFVWAWQESMRRKEVRG